MAQYVYVDSIILRASPPAAGPSRKKLTGDWKGWQDWQNWQDWQDLQNWGSHFEGFGHHLGALEHHLDTIWVPWSTILASQASPGTPKGTHGGPIMDSHGYAGIPSTPKGFPAPVL